MKVGQCLWKGEPRVVVIREDGVFAVNAVEADNTRSLIAMCDEGRSLSAVVDNYCANGKADKLADSLEDLATDDFQLLRPVDPPEAWAVGVTYRRQAFEHDADLERKLGKTDELYQYVYANERAEVFFKGVSRTIVGPADTLWLRADSHLVMPEAELVLVIGRSGLPVAYTMGNDLTAWDIESECPLYLNQAKIWQGSGSIGPLMTPVECVEGPYAFNLSCIVRRNNEIVINAQGSTGGLKRSIEELCYYMNFSNPVDYGSVLFTGTTCVIDHDFSLMQGDIVDVACADLGILSNPIKVHEFPKRDFPVREEEE